MDHRALDASDRAPRHAGRGRYGAVAAAVLQLGCVSYTPMVPEGDPGPTVLLEDTWIPDDGTCATFFVITHIDDRLAQNALIGSCMVGVGEGLALHPRVVATRQVPVSATRARLVGAHMTAAPIHEAAARLAGTNQSAGGKVDFQPIETGACRVTGTL